MAQVVYGLFDDKESAKAAAADFATRTDEHPAFVTSTYARAPLDGDNLPESATAVGGNTLVHTAIGAVTCLIMGIGAGAAGVIPGLSVGMGAVVGLLFGMLAGGLNGLMAGARPPKPELKELEAEIGRGKVLLLIEVNDGAHAKLCTNTLATLGVSIRGRC